MLFLKRKLDPVSGSNLIIFDSIPELFFSQLAVQMKGDQLTVDAGKKD